MSFSVAHPSVDHSVGSVHLEDMESTRCEATRRLRGMRRSKLETGLERFFFLGKVVLMSYHALLRRSLRRGSHERRRWWRSRKGRHRVRIWCRPSRSLGSTPQRRLRHRLAARTRLRLYYFPVVVVPPTLSACVADLVGGVSATRVLWTRSSVIPLSPRMDARSWVETVRRRLHRHRVPTRSRPHQRSKWLSHLHSYC